ncbi:hypothetical protein [Streptomyces bohaiensis]|uniref:Uncharacterized protein n=1 Tax=Streptomyces bohaiensis TaxID=1431344 RepID=A0ABX1C2M0_9ACTN|nr:hypothetical protein [Streptomyces bohaiensis]NJQ13476.1 hypothetical protein [Streptomyces bohaiensis]
MRFWARMPVGGVHSGCQPQDVRDHVWFCVWSAVGEGGEQFLNHRAAQGVRKELMLTAR